MSGISPSVERLKSGAKLLLATGLIISSDPAWAQTYAVKDLGVWPDVPAPDQSIPSGGINYSGIVVGANLTAGAYRAFINGGAWTNLGTLGGSASFGGGISTLNRV